MTNKNFIIGYNKHNTKLVKKLKFKYVYGVTKNLRGIAVDFDTQSYHYVDYFPLSTNTLFVNILSSETFKYITELIELGIVINNSTVECLK